MLNIHKPRIDMIQEIDLDTVALEDVRWHYGTGVSTATGNRRNGTYKPGYRNGVMTNLGDIQEDIWYQVVEHIGLREKEEWLINALTEWENARNFAQRTKKQIHASALDGYAARIFDDPLWVNYIPFNRKYRPHILEQAQIVTVINSCCGKPGDVTQQQIDHAYSGRVCCPHCGRWSAFIVISSQDSPPWEEEFFRKDLRK